MADVSIANLPPLVAAAPPSASIVPFTDTTDHIESPQGTTKGMTVAQLFTSPPISGSLTLTNLTLTGNLVVQGTSNFQGAATFGPVGAGVVPVAISNGTGTVMLRAGVNVNSGFSAGAGFEVTYDTVAGMLSLSSSDRAAGVPKKMELNSSALAVNSTLTVAGLVSANAGLTVSGDATGAGVLFSIVNTAASGHTWRIGEIGGVGVLAFRDVTAAGAPQVMTLRAPGNVGVPAGGGFSVGTATMINPPADGDPSRFLFTDGTPTNAALRMLSGGPSVFQIDVVLGNSSAVEKTFQIQANGGLTSFGGRVNVTMNAAGDNPLNIYNANAAGYGAVVTGGAGANYSFRAEMYTGAMLLQVAQNGSSLATPLTVTGLATFSAGVEVMAPTSVIGRLFGNSTAGAYVQFTDGSAGNATRGFLGFGGTVGGASNSEMVLRSEGSTALTYNGGFIGLRLSATGTITLPTYGAGGGLVTVGAVDSGGSGFRVLRVPN